MQLSCCSADFGGAGQLVTIALMWCSTALVSLSSDECFQTVQLTTDYRMPPLDGNVVNLVKAPLGWLAIGFQVFILAVSDRDRDRDCDRDEDRDHDMIVTCMSLRLPRVEARRGRSMARARMLLEGRDGGGESRPAHCCSSPFLRPLTTPPLFQPPARQPLKKAKSRRARSFARMQPKPPD